ncbi:hypothetical protein DENSPDRAFT_873203 [Dentipellis sp. KUC8613]|nr:hypothetical protein DENSPDRAFT_873203 [Dentipellis sp. KUC8613]
MAYEPFEAHRKGMRPLFSSGVRTTGVAINGSAGKMRAGRWDHCARSPVHSESCHASAVVVPYDVLQSTSYSRTAPVATADATGAIAAAFFGIVARGARQPVVFIGPSSGKIVVVNDSDQKVWFLPRGRKDIGETLEQCALREAYEESGYRAEFLPVCTPTNAPCPPGMEYPDLNTEPIYVTTMQYTPRDSEDNDWHKGGEYIAFYYVGQIPADAVRETKTGMPDEQTYVGHLLDLETAIERLPTLEGEIVRMAHNLWRRTVKLQTKVAQKQSDSQSEIDVQDRANA